MPTTITQAWQGTRVVESESPSLESEYIIEGTNDEFVAQADLDTATALTVFNLVKKEVSITERLGANAWRGSVKWGKFEPEEAGDSSFSFDTGGGQGHKSHSIATLSSTAIPSLPAAPDFQGAIGVTDSSVEGVDVQIPAYNFEETHFFDVSAITAAYKSTLFSLTGGVNNAPYKGFSTGEVLFRGAAGNLNDWTTWEITFKFSASPNATSFPVGPITVPLKRGWDYLWVRYREFEDAAAGHLARQPIAAYVEQVYPMVDLSLLGI
jgi:hypothetical protein